MKGKIHLTVALCVCILAASLPILAYADDGAPPEVMVDGEVIESEKIEAMYDVNQYNSRVASVERKDKKDILNELIEQQIVEELISENGITLSEDEEAQVDNSFHDFYVNYDRVLASGNESEIAYNDSLLKVYEEARLKTGMTKEEFEQYNIESTKYILKRRKLIKEVFNGDESKLIEAVNEKVNSGEVKIQAEDGSQYSFQATE